MVTTDEKEKPGTKKLQAWPRYIEAELGFRNHWYPAFFGAELAEADLSDAHGHTVSNVRTEILLGERILFRRVHGEVVAVEDRCRHRGVALAARPECYTAETITCWYHGFTYRLSDGQLTTVVTDPDSALIGKIGLRSYPVVERAGIVWVFIGDGEPHPLELDVQPCLLDENMTVAPNGWAKVIGSNWRIAVENSFDPGHVYIHRNAPLVIDHRVPTVLGNTELRLNNGMELVERDGHPIGVELHRGNGTPIWETEAAEGVMIEARYRPGQPGVLEGMVPDVSVWLPGGVVVDPFPAPGMLQFEWFVPVDRYHHRYLITWGKRDCDSAQRQHLIDDIETTWRRQVSEEFNHDDVFAREAMAEFYDRGDGWTQEKLYGPDAVITGWRRLTSRRGRGIQTAGHAWARYGGTP